MEWILEENLGPSWVQSGLIRIQQQSFEVESRCLKKLLECGWKYKNTSVHLGSQVKMKPTAKLTSKSNSRWKSNWTRSKLRWKSKLNKIKVESEVEINFEAKLRLRLQWRWCRFVWVPVLIFGLVLQLKLTWSLDLKFRNPCSLKNLSVDRRKS